MTRRPPSRPRRAREVLPTPPAAGRCEGVLALAGARGGPRQAREALVRSVVADLTARTRVRWGHRWLSGREGRAVCLAPVAGTLALADAWALARALERTRGVAACEPALLTPGLEPPPGALDPRLGHRVPAGRARLARPLADRPRPCAAADDWSLSYAAVPEAWRRFEGTGRSPGEGVLVGHPDTGYTRHPTIWGDGGGSRRVLPELGHDCFAHDDDPADSGRGAHPGHGTSTAGLIVGDGARTVGGHRVQGVAPGARIMPLRVNDDVVYYLSYASVIEAVHWAADHGAHVLSMSLGGPLASEPLEEALALAVARGVIPVAASGNVYPFVVYPGRYDACTCVAAANCAGTLWRWTARGRDVDLSAPGETVWVPCLREEAYAIDRSSGSSHATAIVAGAAALWLSFHGRDALRARFGDAGMVRTFQRLLTTRGVSRPSGWKAGQGGAGLLDAEALLAAPLPAATRPAARSARRDLPRRLRGIADLFPDRTPAEVQRALQRLFDADRGDVPRIVERFGVELAYHAAFDPVLRQGVQAGAATARARTAGARRLREGLADDAAFQRDASAELRRALT